MADGSYSASTRRICLPHDRDCPNLASLQEDQVVVGCCPRCQTTGAVDTSGWRNTPNDWAQSLSVIQNQTACGACLCRAVTLQVWPAAARPEGPVFRRWR